MIAIKPNTILAVFLLSTICLMSKANLPANIAEMERAYARISDGKERINSALELAGIKIENNDKSAIKYAEEAYYLADSLDEPLLKAKALRTSAVVWNIFGDHNLALDNLFRALPIFESHNLTGEIAETYRVIGETYRASSSFIKSEEMLDKAVQLFYKTNDSVGIARSFNRRAAVSLEILFAVADSLNVRSDFKVLCSELYAYCDLHPNFKERYNQTLNYALRSMDIASRHDVPDVVISDNIILGSLYTFTNRRDKALEALLTARDQCYSSGKKADLPLIYINIGAHHIHFGNLKDAERFTDTAYTLSVQSEVPVYESSAAQLLSEIYRDLGDYKKAYYFMAKAFEKHDYIFTTDLNLKLGGLQNKYEMDKKDARLAEKQAQIKVQILLFAIITLMAAGIVVLLIMKNRLQHRTNKKLNKQKEIISDQKDELWDLNKTKDKFFSIIAHDLRNPIGNFIQITDLFEQQSELLSDEERKEFVKMLSKTAGNVYELLENLLTWSRMQRGVLKPEYVRFMSSEIVSVLTGAVDRQADSKNIKLKFEIDTDFPIYSDSKMLIAILRNLVTNAVKFTPKGGEVTVSIIERIESVTFKIRDTGIGIPEEMLKDLFRIDTKVSRTGTDGEPSTGLGLILCKEFADLLGGSVEIIESSEVGTLVGVTIPSLPGLVPPDIFADESPLPDLPSDMILE